jgi:CIC family chloride channel protein
VFLEHLTGGDTRRLDPGNHIGDAKPRLFARTLHPQWSILGLSPRLPLRDIALWHLPGKGSLIMGTAGAAPGPKATLDTREEISWGAYIGIVVAAGALGILVACGAWLFNQVERLVHELAFNTFGGWTVALIPALGGIIVALIMALPTRSDKFTGLPHIMDRVGRGSGRLNNRNGLAFVAASALGIGSGAPVGSDTPKAMIGAHLASFLGRRLGMRESFIRALVVAGAGAGIGVTFMAQLGGVLFALEVVLGGFGGWLHVVPSLVAVGTSLFVAIQIFGYQPLYGSIAVGSPSFKYDWTLLLYVGVALLASLAAMAYVNLLPLMRELWGRVRLPFWARTGLAGLLVGVVGIWLPRIFGSGTSVMNEIFTGAAFPVGALVALFVFKLVLTPESLGGGFVGGVIGPALVIGSSLGAAYGDLVLRVFPDSGLSPVAFAMVATAAMLAGSFHAPLFAVGMVYEMTGDYVFLIPLFIAAGISYLLARRFQPGSAYSFMLRSSGATVGRRPDGRLT